MAATETYTPRLKTRYNDELRSELREQLELPSIMQSPTVAEKTETQRGGGVFRSRPSRGHDLSLNHSQLQWRPINTRYSAFMRARLRLSLIQHSTWQDE